MTMPCFVFLSGRLLLPYPHARCSSPTPSHHHLHVPVLSHSLLHPISACFDALMLCQSSGKSTIFHLFPDWFCVHKRNFVQGNSMSTDPWIGFAPACRSRCRPEFPLRCSNRNFSRRNQPLIPSRSFHLH
ncbi:uncharacterized protein BKA78DRAFT_305421 [Phyllosticta capitalensis]|uniref:uncharacterized protein n=1 Tax=Phyllosticta capitalensis TaxID=121624 RepID=UPI00312FEF33